MISKKPKIIKQINNTQFRSAAVNTTPKKTCNCGKNKPK